MKRQSKMMEQRHSIYNQGDDWEKVVDNDTDAIYEHYKKIGKFFHESFETSQQMCC